MSKIISIILYLCIFAGGVAVAIMTAAENTLVMWMGIIISALTLVVGLLTTRDIVKLQKQLSWCILSEESDDKTEYPDCKDIFKR